MTTCKITVTIEINGQTVTDTEEGVRLGEDPAQISAAGMAYGLVEDAWKMVNRDE